MDYWTEQNCLVSKTTNLVKTPIFCNFPSDVLYVAGKTNIPTSWVLCKWMYKCVFVSGQSGTTIWCSASWIAFPSTFFLFTCFIFFFSVSQVWLVKTEVKKDFHDNDILVRLASKNARQIRKLSFYPQYIFWCQYHKN